MPLVASGLSAVLRTALLSDPDTGAVDGDSLTAFCDKLANATITYLLANATITVATTGTAAAQTGTGILT